MSEEPLRFIDAHHHLWIPESRDPDLGYRWLRDIGAMKPFGDPTPIQRNYEWAEFLTESCHELAGSVYLQVDGGIADPVAETAWVQGIFDNTPLKHAIVGLVDLAGEDVMKTIEGHARYSSFRGVRQILSRLDDKPALSFAPRHYLQDARWRDQFTLLGEHSLSFDLQLYPEQMFEAAEFFSSHPEVPVIIDHAGSPHEQTLQGFTLLEDGLKALSSLSHVAIKLCGFGMFDTRRTAGSVKPVVDIILEHFGPERMMFGSNFPVDKLMGSYDDTIRIVSDNLTSLNCKQRSAVYYDNAVRLYRLSEQL
ncbi:MAG: amidohydrolase [Granulosicoccus sp.]